MPSAAIDQAQAAPVICQRVVIMPTKSMLAQVVLSLFFGPLGLFYSSVFGALIIIFAILIGGPTLGVILGQGVESSVGNGKSSGAGALFGGLIGMMTMCAIGWFSSLVWGVIAVNRHNAKVMKMAEG